MHDGRFKGLRQVLEALHRRHSPQPRLGPGLHHPVKLEVAQQRELLIFPFTPTGRDFMTDKRFNYLPE